MSDDDKSLSHLVAKTEEEGVEFCFVSAVEAAAGLVGKDDSRMVDQRSRYGHALLLATAEFCGLVGVSSAVNSGRSWWNWNTKPMCWLRKRANA